ncbi:hypothetical protein [Mucilaginibacter dorajii]|uniref:histidine kinase n=2 Tax=Mucilaginibacter dorajii TaxID=692994 RepID=A0ABP7QEF3_9SPHI
MALLQKDSAVQKEDVVTLLKKSFFASSINDRYQKQFADTLNKYDKPNAPALNTFISALINRRQLKFKAARDLLLRAIYAAEKNGQTYYLYVFYNQLAYTQTDMGNAVASLYSYRQAKKQAGALNNEYYQAVVNLNISDVYTNVQFYAQALVYLNEAQAYCSKYPDKDISLANNINVNKGEVFFQQKRSDSLDVYAERINKANDQIVDIDRCRMRFAAYQLLLKQKYTDAITIIKKLVKDTTAYAYDADRWNLAECYFNNHQPDSAKLILQNLLAGNSQNEAPELRYKYCQLLATIAEQANDYHNASLNSRLALKQAEKFAHNLVELGDLSSQIRLDQIESSYLADTQAYKRERVLLIMAIASSVLVVLVIGMFYYSTKQKRHYEQLLYAAKRKTLAYMNSHEVRRHLSNILGLCALLEDGDFNQEEFATFNKYMLESARQMDESLKSVEQELSGDE